MDLQGNDLLQDMQRLAETIAGDAAADRVEIADQLVHIFTQELVVKGQRRQDHTAHLTMNDRIEHNALTDLEFAPFWTTISGSIL